MILYPLFQRIVRTGWRLIGPVDVTGLQNVPASGPVLVIGNHQSVLDPILVQSFCPRPIHTMAKSTQYSSRIMRFLLPRLLAFPVRRYQVDAQSVRTVLRHLRQGDAVGIYIEGERSWDGRVQRPRLGTLRVILKAGVPVVPVSIAGSYDVLPRWDHALRRAPVRITFGPPLNFPRLDDRWAREAALPAAAATIMGAIQRQLSEGHPAA